MGGAGAAIGVLLGGVLTELVDWRAIFFINLPVGLLLAAGATHLLPADTARPQWRGLDLRGALLATASLGALVYALSQAQTLGRTSTQTLGMGAAALAGLAAFAVLELHTRQPLLRVQRLRDRAVGGGFVMMLAASAVLFGLFLLSSLYLQNVLGGGALETGLAFLPFALAIGAGVHAAGHVITHAGSGSRSPPGSRSCCCSPASARTAAMSLTCCPACSSPASASESSSSRSRSRCSPAPPITRPGCSPG